MVKDALSLRFCIPKGGDNICVYEITACFFCEINVLQFTLDLIAFGLLPHSNQHNFLRPGLTK